MKKHVFWLSLLAMPFVFVACDEEATDNGGNFNPKDAPALFSKVTVDYATDGGSYSSSVEFEYDANNLITRADFSYIEISEGSTSEGSHYAIYTYDSQNRPISSISYNSDGSLDYKEEYTYPAGKIELIIYEYNSGTWEISHKVVFEIDANGHVTKGNYIEYDNGQWLADEDYSSYIWNNDNITKVEYYGLEGTKKAAKLISNKKNWPMIHKYKSLKAAKGYVIEGEATINYNNNVNPFAYASLKNTMEPFDGGIFYSSKNLCSSYSGIEYDETGNETFSASYTYVMNDKNFPTKITIASSSSYPENGETITESDTEVYTIEYK